jgi:hypothetical protein
MESGIKHYVMKIKEIIIIVALTHFTIVCFKGAYVSCYDFLGRVSSEFALLNVGRARLSISGPL